MKAESGTAPPVDRGHIDIFEPVGILPEDRIHFHHDEVLIDRGVGLGDFAFAEGVVEDVVESLQGDAEARSSRRGRSPDSPQARVLLIAVDVGELVELLHGFNSSGAQCVSSARLSLCSVY